MTPLILLKLGGSVITEKNVSEPMIKYENLNRICQEIAESYRSYSFNLIIVHGAGSYGHPIVKETGIHEGITRPEQILSFAKTQVLQNILNSEVCKTLQEFDLPAIPFQPSASATMKNKRLISIDYDLIEKFLSISLIPVLFGVPAFDEAQKCSILSGDQIIVALAKKFHPQKIIFASNVDGIFGEDQSLIPKISHANLEMVKKSFYQVNYDDVTGSMAGKIFELMDITGITAYIINGNKPDILKKALMGKQVKGTVVEF